MKLLLKWSFGLAGLVSIVMIFQNCSGGDANVASNGNSTVYGKDAQDIIQVMQSAGMADAQAQYSLTTPTSLNLIAENMTCSRLMIGTAKQCLFKIKKDDGTYKTLKTTSALVDTLIRFLYISGAKCIGNCSDIESYSVSLLKCVANINFPDQSQCSFIK